MIKNSEIALRRTLYYKVKLKEQPVRVSPILRKRRPLGERRQRLCLLLARTNWFITFPVQGVQKQNS